MNFLAPSLLLGLVAAALPWLVHLIGKRRATPVRFAAMELLMRSERRISARRRLREILLLIARTAIAAALPLAFARPFTELPSDLPQANLGSQSAVILLDDSASMQRKSRGQTLFDRARDQARNLIRQLPGDAELALVVASTGSEPRVGELTGEKGRVLERLETTAPSWRTADFGQALRRSALILTTAQKTERRIFVLTDNQATGWPETPPLSENGAPEVVLMDVSSGEDWKNRAVVALTAEPAPETGVGGMVIEAEIADFSGIAAAGLGVTLRVNGATITKGFVELPASGRARKKFLHADTGQGGVHDIEVSIDGNDDFPADDRRFTRVALARALRLLVINGDARTTARDDEVFFLEHALAAGDRTTSVVTVLPDDVAADRFPQYNAVFLANVGRPSAELSAALIKYVDSGGGLFLSVGSRVDPELWNQRLGKILPQPLSGFTRTAATLPGSTASESVDTRPAERLAPLDRRHPLLSDFPADGQGLASARFFKYLLMEPVSDGSGATVILQYANGAPALVERPFGKGRVMLLSTTIDREWTDFPIQPGFLPLIHESARRLAGTAAAGGPLSVTVGDRRDLGFASDERRVEVTKPDGTLWTAARERGNSSTSATFTETDTPGVFRVAATGFDRPSRPRPEDSFVVNLDRAESDPARLTADKRPDRAHRAASGSPVPKRRVELWHALGALLIAAVLIESLLTLKWRRPTLARERG